MTTGNIDIFFEYLKLFIKGAIQSAAPIVAAIAIVINNRKANERDIEKEKRQIKIDIFKELIELTTVLSEGYISLLAYYSFDIDEIIYELVYEGTTNRLVKVRQEWTKMFKKALYLGGYKQKIMKNLDINVPIDDLVSTVLELDNEVIFKLGLIESISKKYVMAYLEEKDVDLASRYALSDVDKLQKEYQATAGKTGYYFQKEMGELVNYEVVDFVRKIKDETNDSEKYNICQKISRIIKQYKDLSKKEDIIKDFDMIEDKIANGISEVLKQ